VSFVSRGIDFISRLTLLLFLLHVEITPALTVKQLRRNMFRSFLDAKMLYHGTKSYFHGIWYTLLFVTNVAHLSMFATTLTGFQQEERDMASASSAKPLWKRILPLLLLERGCLMLLGYMCVFVGDHWLRLQPYWGLEMLLVGNF